MDKKTKEKIAEFICGDDIAKYPIYRSSFYLTQFFNEIELNYTHDGSTRKRWVFETLQSLSENEIEKVILRLVSPKLYGGDREKVILAQKSMNEILSIESLKIKIIGIDPQLIKETPNFNFEDDLVNKTEKEFITYPAPDFQQMNLEVGIADILEKRWIEIQKCIDSEANLASVILMGSLLEGFLLSIMNKFPSIANCSSSTPKNTEGKPKKFFEWSLSEMIDVAHSIGCIELDVKKFSHSLRDFRNLIHPYQQLAYNTFPDNDTCKISWSVVQAACNDIAEWIKKK